MPVSAISHTKPPVGRRLRRQIDATAAPGELHRVGQQVEQDLQQLAAVGVQGMVRRTAGQHQRDAGVLRARLHDAHGAPGDLLRAAGLLVQL